MAPNLSASIAEYSPDAPWLALDQCLAGIAEICGAPSALPKESQSKRKRDAQRQQQPDQELVVEGSGKKRKADDDELSLFADMAERPPTVQQPQEESQKGAQLLSAHWSELRELQQQDDSAKIHVSLPPAHAKQSLDPRSLNSRFCQAFLVTLRVSSMQEQLPECLPTAYTCYQLVRQHPSHVLMRHWTLEQHFHLLLALAEAARSPSLNFTGIVQTWLRDALLALVHLVENHGNPRKIWDYFVPDRLARLLSLLFDESCSKSTYHEAAELLLRTVLFHADHLDGYADVLAAQKTSETTVTPSAYQKHIFAMLRKLPPETHGCVVPIVYAQFLVAYRQWESVKAGNVPFKAGAILIKHRRVEFWFFEACMAVFMCANGVDTNTEAIMQTCLLQLLKLMANYRVVVPSLGGDMQEYSRQKSVLCQILQNALESPVSSEFPAALASQLLFIEPRLVVNEQEALMHVVAKHSTPSCAEFMEQLLVALGSSGYLLDIFRQWMKALITQMRDNKRLAESWEHAPDLAKCVLQRLEVIVGGLPDATYFQLLQLLREEYQEPAALREHNQVLVCWLQQFYQASRERRGEPCKERYPVKSIHRSGTSATRIVLEVRECLQTVRDESDASKVDAIFQYFFDEPRPHTSSWNLTVSDINDQNLPLAICKELLEHSAVVFRFACAASIQKLARYLAVLLCTPASQTSYPFLRCFANLQFVEMAQRRDFYPCFLTHLMTTLLSEKEDIESALGSARQLPVQVLADNAVLLRDSCLKLITSLVPDPVATLLVEILSLVVDKAPLSSNDLAVFYGALAGYHLCTRKTTNALRKIVQFSSVENDLIATCLATANSATETNVVHHVFLGALFAKDSETPHFTPQSVKPLVTGFTSHPSPLSLESLLPLCAKLDPSDHQHILRTLLTTLSPLSWNQYTVAALFDQIRAGLPQTASLLDQLPREFRSIVETNGIAQFLQRIPANEVGQLLDTFLDREDVLLVSLCVASVPGGRRMKQVILRSEDILHLANSELMHSPQSSVRIYHRFASLEKLSWDKNTVDKTLDLLLTLWKTNVPPSAVFDSTIQYLLILCRREPRAVASRISRVLLLLHTMFQWLLPSSSKAKQPATAIHDCARSFLRILKVLASAQFRKQCKKHAPLLLAQYVADAMEVALLPRDASLAVMESMYLLLDVCGDHEKQSLMVAFDSQGKAVFKDLYAKYERGHKFSGKI